MPIAVDRKALMKRLRDSFLMRYLKSNPLQFAATMYIGVSVILVIVGPWIVPHSPTVSNASAQLLPPSWTYPFGTDINGMCVFSRTICAFRTDLFIALGGAMLALAVGAPLGVFAGFYDGRRSVGGAFSTLILRFMDVLQAFPIFVLALILVAMFGPRPINIIFLIAIANLPSNLRMARGEALMLRERAFIEAARGTGNREIEIAFKHLFSNCLTPVISLLSLVMGFGILLTAGVSFVGAGVRIPTAEWGLMIATGAPQMLTGEWWTVFFPGIVMGLTIFLFSMAGQAVTSLMDPLERVKLGYSR
jgi:peptide/nickel transport system permease protein